MRIAILALSGALLSGCSMLGFGNSGDLFGTSGYNNGCYDDCSGQYSGQTSTVYGHSHQDYASPQQHYASASSCEPSPYSQPAYYASVAQDNCYPTSTYSAQDYAPSTSYTASTYPSQGTSYHVASGFEGQNIGFNPVLGAAALGGVPALRGQFGSRNNSHFYGNAGLNWYDVDTDALGLQLRGGYQANRHLGAEVEGSLGINGDAAFAGGFDYTLGAFAVSRAPITNRLDVLSRIGYYYANLDNGIEEDNIAYGIGAEYALSPRDGVRVDYTRYEGLATDSVAVSYARKF